MSEPKEKPRGVRKQVQDRVINNATWGTGYPHGFWMRDYSLARDILDALKAHELD